jgi:hypothetical protein
VIIEIINKRINEGNDRGTRNKKKSRNGRMSVKNQGVYLPLPLGVLLAS